MVFALLVCVAGTIGWVHSLGRTSLEGNMSGQAAESPQQELPQSRSQETKTSHLPSQHGAHQASKAGSAGSAPEPLPRESDFQRLAAESDSVDAWDWTCLDLLATNSITSWYGPLRIAGPWSPWNTTSGRHSAHSDVELTKSLLNSGNHVVFTSSKPQSFLDTSGTKRYQE